MRLRRARELAGWLLRRRSWVRVQGQSMLPTLEPGDLVLTARRRARVGDLVVLPDPREPARVLVKRVGALQGAQIRVASDNPAGADSRTFGRFRPMGRRQLLRPAPPFLPVESAGPLVALHPD